MENRTSIKESKAYWEIKKQTKHKNSWKIFTIWKKREVNMGGWQGQDIFDRLMCHTAIRFFFFRDQTCFSLPVLLLKRRGCNKETIECSLPQIPSEVSNVPSPCQTRNEESREESNQAPQCQQTEYRIIFNHKISRSNLIETT